MPRNYDENSTSGLTSLREGIRKSVNLVAVRIVKELVPASEVTSTASRMGITTEIRAVDAIAPWNVGSISARYGQCIFRIFKQRVTEPAFWHNSR